MGKWKNSNQGVANRGELGTSQNFIILDWNLTCTKVGYDFFIKKPYKMNSMKCIVY